MSDVTSEVSSRVSTALKTLGPAIPPVMFPGSRKKAAGATLAWGQANGRTAVRAHWEQHAGRVRCRERPGRRDRPPHPGTGHLRPGGSEGRGSNGHVGSQRGSRGAGPRRQGGLTHPALPAGADCWRDAGTEREAGVRRGSRRGSTAGAEGRVLGRGVSRAEHPRTAGARGLEASAGRGGSEGISDHSNARFNATKRPDVNLQACEEVVRTQETAASCGHKVTQRPWTSRALPPRPAKSGTSP